MKKLNSSKTVLSMLVILLFSATVKSQIDSGIQTLTDANDTHDVRSISGDGRFIVISSRENIATYNPRNADKNLELFLYDVAQRHIFQITDTKSATQPPDCSNPPVGADIKAAVVNYDPVISNDGKWIAFSSNATTSTPGNPNNTNPGNFDGNATGNADILLQDGNAEIWIYQLPNISAVDLPSGETPPFVNLAGGNFTQVTNTPPSRPTVPATCTINAIIAGDSRQSSIDDTGATIAFVSNRDLVDLNAPPANNDEIFTYKRGINTLNQITRTPQSTIQSPSNNSSPTLSSDGLRVALVSEGVTNPIKHMNGGSNPDFNAEVYFADLNSSGDIPSPLEGLKVQVTNTTNFPGEVILRVGLTRTWISRNGRYLLFESRAKLDTNSNENGTGYAMYLYDSENTTSNPFKRIGPYSNADSVVSIEQNRFAEFSDYNNSSGLEPGTIVFASRINMRPDGTVPTNPTEGLNPSSSRPIQVYRYPLSGTNPIFTRITSSPITNQQLFARCYPANSSVRITCLFNRIFEPRDQRIYHLLTPVVTEEYEPFSNDNSISFFYKGASALPITSGQGLMPNMLGGMRYVSSPSFHQGLVVASNVSITRLFSAPLQLDNTSLTIDGVSVPVRAVTTTDINFIVPSNISPGIKPVTFIHAGRVMRSSINIIQSPQPDIVTNNTGSEPTPYGRAKILNVTDPSNPQTEPFRVTTQTSSGTVPTKLRLFLTGVEGVNANSINIKLGDVTVPNGSIVTNAVADDYPGVFTFDFTVPAQLDGAGNVPVTVTTTVNGQSSRPVETAPQTRFISTQAIATDLAVWRPGNGTWYILDNNGANPIYMQWGLGSDIPAPGDYDGDHKTDFCVFRPSEGIWYFYKTTTQVLETYSFGQSGDKTAQADYDGDGKTDIAVYRPSTGVWYYVKSSDNQAVSEHIGVTGDEIVPADYDGDGKADPAFWKNSEAAFYIKGTIQNSLFQTSLGQSGDKPVIGDYDGDGKTDLATWRSSDNTWRILNSSTNQITSIQWGDFSLDIPVPGDYDADGKTDIAVWRSSGSQVGWWYIRQSGNGQLRAEQWGTTGDIPVPASW